MDGLLSGAMAESGGSFVTAILVVSLGLVALALVFWLMKRRGAGGATGAGRKTQRLAVLDSVAVDTRRRLVLIRRDEVEHLVMIGGPSDIVVESRIGAREEDESSLATVVIDRARTQRPAEPERPLPRPPEPRMAQQRADQFPAERFAETPAAPPAAEPRPAAVAPAAPSHPARISDPTPGVRAGNPFDEADFSAVMDAEMERRSTHREPALHVEPAARPEPANQRPEREEPARPNEGSLEDEMARLLADMSTSRRD